MSIVDLTGSMLLAGPSRPGVGFRAEVIALGDTATGMVGRAVWTDEHGDHVYSEIRGDGTVDGQPRLREHLSVGPGGTPARPAPTS